MKFKEVLVYLFLFLLPTQLGKHFFLPFSYISGVRIDYLAPTIYLTDGIIFVLIILSFKQFKFSFSTKMLILLGLTCINIAFSLSPWISLYKWIKIAEVTSLFYIFKTKLNTKYILLSLTAGAAIQFFLVIYQITQQHSLQGIAYVFGERYFSISTAGIAKVTIQGIELLRGYGTFSHPNSMGGFFVLLYAYMLFEKNFSKYIILKYIFIALSSFLILLSFSKNAILSFLIISIYYASKYISCRFCAFVRIFGILLISFLFLSAQGDSESFQKRLYLLQNAIQTIMQYPITGTGLGSYLLAQVQFPIPYSYLFFQPVHNIFLLLIAEIGVIFFGYIIYIVFPSFKRILKKEIMVVLILLITFTGFFDHYWLTLQQNMLLVPVVFGLLKHQKWG
ncbi:MAG TPA: O-antigen ligase family protein [Candidatus Woesebacteria bacterium]|nr:O-antigen ligase family protein [Candidatus Woesebacteria bacterium]